MIESATTHSEQIQKFPESGGVSDEMSNRNRLVELGKLRNVRADIIF